MSPSFYVMVAITFFCGMGLLACVMVTRTSRSTAERMFAVTSGTLDPAERPDPLANVKRRGLQLLRWLRLKAGMAEKSELIDRFMAAGVNNQVHRDIYGGTRVLGPIVGLLVGSIMPGKPMFWIMSFAGVAYLGPDIILTRMVKRRREKIRLGVPDAIDLLVICVDAGLGLDQAMMRVGQELATSHPEIHDEFLQINREQRAGKLRLDAWQALAKRTQLQEIDGFVNMLMQTDRFGTPIAKALSSFGDMIRQKRRQRAEELAAKTTVKIIFPLVLFIFPSMFIVLLGPAGINIARQMSGTP